MLRKRLTAIAIAVGASFGLIAQDSGEEGPVSYVFDNNILIAKGKPFEVSISFSIQKDWYIYAPTGVNALQGKIETRAIFITPSGISRIGKIKLSEPIFKSGYQVYEGDNITMRQSFLLSDTIDPGQYEIKLKITYQTCNDEICLPPITDEVKSIIQIVETSKPQSRDEGESMILKFTALDGREIDVSSLKGKVTLIDCWATWCGPCLNEMSNIKMLYDKYHNKGFEVIGISMDEASAKKRVLQLIKEKKITWPQRFEGKGFHNDSFRKLYEIQSLPTVYLIDKEGNIVDSNARGERLEPLLKKYLEL